MRKPQTRKPPDELMNKQLHIYCSEKTRSMLEQLSEHNHRTMSSQVKFLIDEAFRKELLK